MSTQQSRPVITPAMREQALKQPNTWLYIVDPIFTDPEVDVPPWGFIGGYRVDEQGQLTDDFSPNPNYRPSPVALRLPAPSNNLERALQLTTTGYAQGQTLLNAMLDSELILFAQPQGSGLFTLEHESGRRQLQVFTSDSFLPPRWSSWQRMTGRTLAAQDITALDIQLNPGSQVKARIPGEDLLKAAGTVEGRAAIEAASSPAPTVEKPIPRHIPESAGSNSTPQATEATDNTTTPGPPPFGAPGSPELTQPVPRESVVPADPADNELGRRFVGSLLAGAMGDALGAPIEFSTSDQIRSRYGDRGVIEYDRDTDNAGEFTDDTQLMLFTAEGVIRGHVAVRNGTCASPLPAIQLAYQRWLHTQGYTWGRTAGPFVTTHPEPTGWLIKRPELFAVRSPNSTCISALREFASAGTPGTFDHRINDADDVTGVVRVAPIALWSDDPKEVFELAAASAALTCSNPNGYLPAGVLATLVHQLLRGDKLADALTASMSLLTGYAGHEETARALDVARELASAGSPTPEQLKDRIGAGWSGHEALGIAVCAALSTEGIAPAVMLAVNHSGASDSTGAICGNIVGALYGSSALPGLWLRDLKHREVVETLARDVLAEFGTAPPRNNTWAERYPADRDTSDVVFTSTLLAAGGDTRTAEPSRPKPDKRGRFVGCLLGGAVGDALGHPVENDTVEAIRQKFGPKGLTDFVDAQRPGGSISDDTQMTLFTLDGLIRANVRRRVHGETEPATQVQQAYQRWLHTQGYAWKDAAGPGTRSGPDGWLIESEELFVRRAPGDTSLLALSSYATGKKVGSFTHRVNDSKGCGGVMRAAPAGLWSEDTAQVFQVGALTAALTHGHPSGFLPAGVLAVIVQQVLQDRSLPDAVDRALTELATWDGHEETSAALRRAVELAGEGPPGPELLQERLGSGSSGEQALAVAVCAALSYPDSFADAVRLAANHSGASDSTSAICGNIMGAVHSATAIPAHWYEKLELRGVIQELAEDAIREFGTQPPTGEDWERRYPTIEATVAPADEAVAEAPDEDEQDDGAASAEGEASHSAVEVDTAPPSNSESVTVASPPTPSPVESPTTTESDSARAVPEESSPGSDDDEGLSDEESRLLAAWRKFRDGADESTPADLSDGLHKLLAEAFGEERAAQLIEGDPEDQTPEESELVEQPPQVSRAQRVTGCLLGGAVGDALGAPWMFTGLETIIAEHPDGLTAFTEFLGKRGACSSLSQQSVFVFDGLVRAALCARLRGVDANTYPPGMVRLTLQHWLLAQGAHFEPSLAPGELVREPALRTQRFPDEATFSAITQNRDAGDAPTATNPPNSARSAAATARGAVVGFYSPTAEAAVALGSEVAVITHGHPDGYLPAGALAGLVSSMAGGAALGESVTTVIAELELLEGSERTVRGLRDAVELAANGSVTSEDLATLGTGWDGPTALSIAVCAALTHPEDIASAVALAATHSGNSAATAMMCGSVLGTAHGEEGVPHEWLNELELREILEQLSVDHARVESEIEQGGSAPEWATRYLD